MFENDIKDKFTIDISNGWMPDQNLENIGKAGGLKTAKNILPVSRQYRPMQGLTVYNDTAITGTGLTGFSTQDTDGQYYNFLGTTTKLYRFTNVSLTDITRAVGGDYTGSSWWFTEYGSWLIGTNFADDIQVLKGITSANFQALGGSPPKAKYCLLNNGHLILANLTEGGIKKPKKMKWSARDSIEDWTPSLTTGAGEKEFSEMFGGITGIGAVGDNFILASENSVTIGYFVGGAYTFNFKINAYKNIGCYYPQSFISIKDLVLFWGKEDIYIFDGVNIKAIGEHRVKETILQDINSAYIHRISVSHDRDKKLIKWAYPSLSSTGNPDRLLIYNYAEDRFTHAELSLQCLLTAASGGISIDELTTSSIDATNISIDSDYWLSKNIIPMAVDTDGKIKTFAGAGLQAELETGEFFSEPLVLQVQKAYIPVDTLSGSGEVKVKHRYSPSVGQSISGISNIKSDGSADLRTTNKRLSLNIKATNFISFGNTIECEVTKTGGR